MNIAKEIGARIRTFRKNRGLSQTELAQKINKSKSTLSKYETGEICIDLITLCEIADQLKLSPEHFFHFLQSEHQNEARQNLLHTIPEFYRRNKLYLYFWDGRNESLNTSVLLIKDQTPGTVWSYQAEIYMNVKDISDYTLCENTYVGTIEFHHVLTNIHMVHSVTPIEHIMISVLEQFTPSETKIALFSGISFRPLTPIAFKMMISKEPIKEQDKILQELHLSKWELKKIKTNNYFTVNRS